MLRRFLRKLFLCLFVGGRSLWPIRMSQEQIENLLFSTHQPKVEETLPEAIDRDVEQRAQQLGKLNKGDHR